MLDSSGFDRWADSYREQLDRRPGEFPFQGYHDVLAAVRRLVEPCEGLTVLDVGAGDGLLAQELDARGCRVTGIDFSAGMLLRARTRLPGGVFREVDVSKEHFGEFNDRRFDRIVSTYFLHHLNRHDQIELLVRTARNNLTPGGTIIAADIGFATAAEYEAAHAEYESAWDDNEYYFCGEALVSQLESRHLVAEYTQISCCAGTLWCRPAP